MRTGGHLELVSGRLAGGEEALARRSPSLVPSRQAACAAFSRS